MLNIITLSEEEIKEIQDETDKKINEYISKLTQQQIDIICNKIAAL